MLKNKKIKEMVTLKVAVVGSIVVVNPFGWIPGEEIDDE